MKVGFLDCFSGVSGDMLLGAFVHAGWPEAELKAIPEKLGLCGVEVSFSLVKRGSVSGINVQVIEREPPPLRTLQEIENILLKSEVPTAIKERAFGVMERIASAEAAIHGCSLNDVHFHEIGAADTLVDVVGAFLACAHFSLDHVTASSLPLARGFVDSAHGRLPLPAPATLLLLKDVPVYDVNLGVELVTPTGAALITAIAHSFGPFPEMVLKKTGYGAGKADIPGHLNLLRLWLGERKGGEEKEHVFEISCHLDDMNPEWFGYLMDRLFEEGAVDVAAVPLYMKKNRPGFGITVISPLGFEDKLCDILLTESTTIGVRLKRCCRKILPRQSIRVDTEWGSLEAKLIKYPDGSSLVMPEYEECKKAAKTHNVPLKRIYEAVTRSGQ